MQIIHKIDNFLYTIFPSVIPGDQQSLLHAIQEFYTYGPHRPSVTIDNDFVSIDIDIPAILAQDKDYQKVIAFCEKAKYSEAKPILKKLIVNNPSISEYHRIMGQILSDEGNQEEAINCLIDALRWDSKNGWALLMMGIFLQSSKMMFLPQ
jgi:tetratricopeptide (TPR) repeat protein